MWKWRLTILELYHEQSQAKHSPEVHGQRVEESASSGERSGGFYEGVRRVKKVRLGAWLEICRLQLPYLDFQLHPPHRLNGRGKITSELLCLLPFL